jgi:hypothetical protein
MGAGGHINIFFLKQMIKMYMSNHRLDFRNNRDTKANVGNWPGRRGGKAFPLAKGRSLESNQGRIQAAIKL